MPLAGPSLRSSRSLSAGVSFTIILIFLIVLCPHANIGQYNEPIQSKQQSKKGLKAIVTNVQNEHYVTNALVLGYTLQKYNPTLADQNIEAVLMVPYKHDITPKSMSQLKEVGWIIRYEEDLAVEGVQSLPLNYQRNFIKLRVWRWIDYLKIAWIDADCMVKGDVSFLLSTDFGTFKPSTASGTFGVVC
jgi:alpha-N-acetylglucosamine transferase